MVLTGRQTVHWERHLLVLLILQTLYFFFFAKFSIAVYLTILGNHSAVSSVRKKSKIYINYVRGFHLVLANMTKVLSNSINNYKLHANL